MGDNDQVFSEETRTVREREEAHLPRETGLFIAVAGAGLEPATPAL